MLVKRAILLPKHFQSDRYNWLSDYVTVEEASGPCGIEKLIMHQPIKGLVGYAVFILKPRLQNFACKEPNCDCTDYQKNVTLCMSMYPQAKLAMSISALDHTLLGINAQSVLSDSDLELAQVIFSLGNFPDIDKVYSAMIFFIPTVSRPYVRKDGEYCSYYHFIDSIFKTIINGGPFPNLFNGNAYNDALKCGLIKSENTTTSIPLKNCKIFTEAYAPTLFMKLQAGVNKSRKARRRINQRPNRDITPELRLTSDVDDIEEVTDKMLCDRIDDAVLQNLELTS